MGSAAAQVDSLARMDVEKMNTKWSLDDLTHTAEAAALHDLRPGLQHQRRQPQLCPELGQKGSWKQDTFAARKVGRAWS